jgi:hypothetical protein
VVIVMLSTLSKAPSLVGTSPADRGCERSVDRLLRAVGATPSTSIAVAGPLAGAAMSALWRHGIERVEAARRITSPSADQLSDVLLILGCDTADQAAEILTAVLPILSIGGYLAIDASRMSGFAERGRLCQILAHRGFRYREGVQAETEIVAYKPDVAELFAIAS